MSPADRPGRNEAMPWPRTTLVDASTRLGIAKGQLDFSPCRIEETY